MNRRVIRLAALTGTALLLAACVPDDEPVSGRDADVLAAGRLHLNCPTSSRDAVKLFEASHDLTRDGVAELVVAYRCAGTAGPDQLEILNSGNPRVDQWKVVAATTDRAAPLNLKGGCLLFKESQLFVVAHRQSTGRIVQRMVTWDSDNGYVIAKDKPRSPTGMDGCP